MDLRVAVGAGDILRSLAMHRSSRRYRARESRGIRGRVALQAEHVYVAHVQQARIGRAVRRVAGRAALSLHNWVLIDKGASRLGMALGADCILIGGALQILFLESSVRIVAIAAIQ